MEVSKEEFAKHLIDTILDRAEELNFAWHYGEESMLVVDIINIINNEAGTDYKRYGGGFMKYDECSPHIIDKRCHECKLLFKGKNKANHREYCCGMENASECEKYEKWKIFEED